MILSFNGAGVFRPRKCRKGNSYPVRSQASMGPGSFDPGSGVAPRTGGTEPTMLQWGRGLSTPEVLYLTACQVISWCASMGPGSFDPGSNVLIVPPALENIALQWGRGLSTPEVCQAQRLEKDRTSLQWGRGLSTPEVLAGSAVIRDPAPLQWGRGLSTPEVRFQVLDTLVSQRLQWGRGLSTPEVLGCQAEPRCRTSASMGPGSFDPGSAFFHALVNRK